jgi:hypothetical protein
MKMPFTHIHIPLNPKISNNNKPMKVYLIENYKQLKRTIIVLDVLPRMNNQKQKISLFM